MRKINKLLFICFGSLIVVMLGAWLHASADNAYLSVTGPCYQTFPQDHGAHPGYRTEWWYYTGNLKAESGDQYGYQLTFFRSQISPPGADARWPQPSSDWRTQQLFVGHAAISDLGGQKHYHAERMAREALTMAGTTQKEGTTTIFVGPWSATISADTHNLTAKTPDFSIDFALQSSKPPVLHGKAGYSRKGSSAQNASCYYSLTRLLTRGKLGAGGKMMAVEGLSWMDHEYSTAPLENGIIGWDWFSLQLSDQTELMLYLLRQPDKQINDASSGTFIDASGVPRHLSNHDFNIRVLKEWKSPQSGGVYPVAWRIKILPLDLELNVAANLADQEMLTAVSTGVTYWEGSVSGNGAVVKKQVQAKGYVELTGYASAFDAPM